jgi:hypothetical protein
MIHRFAEAPQSKPGPYMRSDDEHINAAIDLLRGNGYSVLLAGNFHWETPGEFRSRLQVSTAHFDRRVKAPNCPCFLAERGPSGRILKLQSNPDFEAWMKPRRPLVHGAPAA